MSKRKRNLNDQALEAVAGLEAPGTYDIEHVFLDLLNLIKSKELELLSEERSEESATGSKESAFMANQIASGREVAKLAATRINAMELTTETILERRMNLEEKEARLLIQSLKFIAQHLAPNHKTDKHKLAMDLRGIKEALAACVTHSVSAASDASPTPTPDAPSSSRNTLVHTVHSEVKPDPRRNNILTPKEDNRCEATHSGQSANKVVQRSIGQKPTVANARGSASAQVLPTAASAVHPVSGTKILILTTDSVISSGRILSVTRLLRSDGGAAASSASKPTSFTSVVAQLGSVGGKSFIRITYPKNAEVLLGDSVYLSGGILKAKTRDGSKQTTSCPTQQQVAQHGSVGRISLLKIRYPLSSKNQSTVFNSATGKTMVLPKPVTFNAIHPARGIRTTVASANLRALNPAAVRSVTPKPAKVTPVRASVFPQPSVSDGSSKGASPRSELEDKNGPPSQSVRPNLIRLRPIHELTEPRLRSMAARGKKAERSPRVSFPTQQPPTVSTGHIAATGRRKRSSIADAVQPLSGSMISGGKKIAPHNDVMVPDGADSSLVVKNEPQPAGREWKSTDLVKKRRYAEGIEILGL